MVGRKRERIEPGKKYYPAGQGQDTEKGRALGTEWEEQREGARVGAVGLPD